MKLSGPHPLLLWSYGCALVIDPRQLRFSYRDQMLQGLRDNNLMLSLWGGASLLRRTQRIQNAAV